MGKAERKKPSRRSRCLVLLVFITFVLFVLLANPSVRLFVGWVTDSMLQLKNEYFPPPKSVIIPGTELKDEIASSKPWGSGISTNGTGSALVPLSSDSNRTEGNAEGSNVPFLPLSIIKGAGDKKTIEAEGKGNGSTTGTNSEGENPNGSNVEANTANQNSNSSLDPNPNSNQTQDPNQENQNGAGTFSTPTSPSSTLPYGNGTEFYGPPEESLFSKPLNCEGKYIFMYDLPEKYNQEFLDNCATIHRSVNMCDAFSHGGVGWPANRTSPYANITEEVQSTQAEWKPLPPEGTWYETDQFSLEIIFHSKMKNYPCLTTNPYQATLFYIPFYPGLSVFRSIYEKNFTERDRHAKEVVHWLKQFPWWDRHRGRDHLLIITRVLIDFTRDIVRKDWGNTLVKSALFFPSCCPPFPLCFPFFPSLFPPFFPFFPSLFTLFFPSFPPLFPLFFPSSPFCPTFCPTFCPSFSSTGF